MDGGVKPAEGTPGGHPGADWILHVASKIFHMSVEGERGNLRTGAGSREESPPGT